jgi:hypothetical protein
MQSRRSVNSDVRRPLRLSMFGKEVHQRCASSSSATSFRSTVFSPAQAGTSWPCRSTTASQTTTRNASERPTLLLLGRKSYEGFRSYWPAIAEDVTQPSLARRKQKPRIGAETTNTEIIVRMVEAGMGVSVIPLMPGGVVTRGRRVKVRNLDDQMKPLEVGVLARKGERPCSW